MHENSAMNIKCIDTGIGTYSFSFDQYAGTLVCSGTGTTKVYQLNICQQDIPIILYAKMTNNACCANPTTCAAGVSGASLYPSVD